MKLALFIVIFMISAVIAGLLLVIMVRKYYWGPTGLPPKQRYQPKADPGDTKAESDKPV